MRILLIHNFYQWRGGEDNYVINLQSLLKEKGHRVYLYSKDSGTIKTPQDKIKTAMDIFGNRSVYLELSNAIRKFHPDVAQVQNIFPLITYSAYKACIDNKIPIVQRISNYRFICPKGTLYRNNAVCELCVNRTFPLSSIIFGCYHQSQLASFLLSGSLSLNRYKIVNSPQAYIFPSEFTKQYVRKCLQLPSEKTFVIPTFTADSFPVEKPHKEDSFVYVGRLSEEKGILFLLEQFRKLPRLKLRVIGDGPLRKKVDDYDRFPNISVMGQLSKQDAALHMAKALMTVIPSRSFDVLPQVLIESFRQGTPVLVPNIDSFPYLVTHMKTGLLYDLNDSNSLKKWLLYAYKHKNIILHTSSDVLKTYTKSYTWNRHYSLLMKVYKKTII